MFCDEPIQKVWYLRKKDGNKNERDFLMYHFRLEYYPASGEWLVFETSNCYVSIGSDGVKKYASKDSFLKPDYELYNYDDWDEEESFLSEEALYFEGERIQNITKENDGWNIVFDHLELRLYNQTSEEKNLWSSYYQYIPYLYLSHKLKNCSCGGQAELMLDHVDDYFVRCSRCLRSTYAERNLARIVNAWNSGEVPVKNCSIPFESFLAMKGQHIVDIYIPKEATKPDRGHFTCDNLILQFEKTAFQIDWLFIPHDQCVLNAAGSITSFNHQMWPYTVTHSDKETISFVSCNRGIQHETLQLTVGKRVILITAMSTCLDVQIT